MTSHRASIPTPRTYPSRTCSISATPPPAAVELTLMTLRPPRRLPRFTRHHDGERVGAGRADDLGEAEWVSGLDRHGLHRESMPDFGRLCQDHRCWSRGPELRDPRIGASYQSGRLGISANSSIALSLAAELLSRSWARAARRPLAGPPHRRVRRARSTVRYQPAGRRCRRRGRATSRRRPRWRWRTHRRSGS